MFTLKRNIPDPGDIHYTGSYQMICPGRSIAPTSPPDINSPSESWHMGLASVTGLIRAHNEDAGICFQLQGYDVIIIADGMGGVPYGEQASECVVQAAATRIVHTLHHSTSTLPACQHICIDALTHAYYALAVSGYQMSVRDVADGLRTTLIILVAHEDEVGLAYIGDGGAFVIEEDGSHVPFLAPQKADNAAPNVLAASLGPIMEGSPRACTVYRNPGDLVVIGTDGVFDRVSRAFFPALYAMATAFHGDLQKTAEQALTDLALMQDSIGYIYDDNMTLGLLSDHTGPTQSQEESEASPAPRVHAETTPDIPSQLSIFA